MKISIIGSGNVGATLAKRVIESDTADVVLLDVIKGLAEGKALDILHSAPLLGFQRDILGTDDFKDTRDSDVVVITAGYPRQPGMSRNDLLKKNGEVIKDISKKIKDTSSDAIIIVVTNPLDVMTYIAYKESEFMRNRVMGMAGLLDTSRFAYIIAKSLKADYKDVETIVLGQHGPDMVPIISHTKVRGRPIADVISKEALDELIKELRESGTKIVNLLGKGSAYYAPSAATFSMIEAITNNKKRLMGVSCFCQGEYNLSDVCTGLPVRLGRNGIEEIVRLNLDKSEMEALKKSADITKKLLSEL